MQFRKRLLVREHPTGAFLRLVLWVVLLGLLAVAMLQMDSLATAGLFQSDLPTPAERQTATVSATPTQEAVPPVAATPVLTASLPLATVTALPSEALPSAPATGLPEVPAEATISAPGSELGPKQPEKSVTQASGVEERARYPEEQASLRFRWRTLFDSLALGISYLWLGCGVSLALLMAAVFLGLWLRGRHSAER